MSQLEVGRVTTPVYSYTFPAMASGTVTTTNDPAVYGVATFPLRFFFPATSRILGLVLVTAGGTVGTPYVNNKGAVINSTATGYFPQLSLNSSNVADTSVYKVYWTNEVGSSNLVSVLPC